ncbi:hypothetical protein H0X32_02600 [Patescibacteria group bacterium]|nr:hypothetical protein [Patescibacteria group bacterium]
MTKLELVRLHSQGRYLLGTSDTSKVDLPTDSELEGIYEQAAEKYIRKGKLVIMKRVFHGCTVQIPGGLPAWVLRHFKEGVEEAIVSSKVEAG